jgi:hypothetical protein
LARDGDGEEMGIVNRLMISRFREIYPMAARVGAVIVGASDYVNPKATLAGLIPALNYFAVWYILALVAFVFIGIETRGRTIEELDIALDKRAPAPAHAATAH